MPVSTDEQPQDLGFLAELSNTILVQRATDGDADAFGEIVRRHSPLMRAYVYRIVGSRARADDVVQESLITAWRQLATLRDPAAVRSWLVRIAGREALAQVKAQPIEVDVEVLERTPDRSLQPEAAAVRNATLRALSAALDTLPDNERRCWLLREVAGLSYQEIAEEMELPPSTVRGNLARARARITIEMEGWR